MIETGIDQYLKQIKNIRKDNVYNYEYEYWFGTDNKMEKDGMCNLVFGNTREGYENY
jgi:hypothetical protein